MHGAFFKAQVFLARGPRACQHSSLLACTSALRLIVEEKQAKLLLQRTDNVEKRHSLCLLFNNCKLGPSGFLMVCLVSVSGQGQDCWHVAYSQPCSLTVALCGAVPNVRMSSACAGLLFCHSQACDAVCLPLTTPPCKTSDQLVFRSLSSESGTTVRQQVTPPHWHDKEAQQSKLQQALVACTSRCHKL